MLSFEEIELLAKKRGILKSELARVAGYSGHWRRMRRTMSLGDLPFNCLQRIAALLDMPLAAITGEGSNLWTPHHRTQTDRMTSFNVCMREAADVITLTEGVDSYLLNQTWMVEWLNVEWRQVQGWNEHKRLYLPYIAENKAIRNKGRYLHRIVCPEQLFIDAAKLNPEWLRDLRHSLGDLEDVTALIPVTHWDSFRRAVNAVLQSWLHEWEKIVIIDRSVMMIYLYRRIFVQCDDAIAVSKVRAAVEAYAMKSPIRDQFPINKVLTPKNIRLAAQITLDRLESLLPLRRRTR